MASRKNSIDLEINDAEEKTVRMGNNLRRLRIAANVKQEVIASALNITQQAVSKLELRDVIDDETIDKIAPLLGVAPIIIKNLKDDCEQNTSNFFDYSQQNKQNSTLNITFNPIDKVIELSKDKDKLYELVIAVEKEKFQIVDGLLKENRFFLEKLLNEKK